MKIIFDQNVPRALARNLGPHQVTRSAEKGWQELKNGDLLAAAEAAGFDLLITCDQNLEYQQNLTGRKIAIIALSTNNWPLIRERAEAVVTAVAKAKPGTYRTVDCGVFRKAKRSTGRGS